MTSDPARTRIIASEADVAITQELPKGMAQPLDAEILMGAPHAADPAATLNAAAARLRELAGAATEGPWVARREWGEDIHWGGYEATTLDAPSRNLFAVAGLPLPDAELMAALGPPVALALADWLAYQASVHEDECWSSCDCQDSRYALAVARLVLGESDG